jgi:hypothetical protein
LQNYINTNYSGLEELLSAEKYRESYNDFIVQSCFYKVKNPKVIVDFGAGIGTLSEIIKTKFGVSPVCVEIDKENITYLDNRKLQNLNSINDIKTNIDLIFSSNVLELIEDDLSVFESFKSKLNDDGYLYLYLPANMILWTQVDESVGHFRRYSRSEIKQKLLATGFEIKSIYFADSIGYLAILLLKLIRYNTNNIIESSSSLKFYDKYVFPLSKFLDGIGVKFLFGKNLVILAKKK